MMTCEEIVVQALARLREFGDVIAPTRSILYRRIGVRQQQLAVLASRANPDYYGVRAEASVIGGMIDLSDMPGQVPTAQRVTEVTIGQPGGSGYPTGTRVSIVRSHDVGAGEPPRATLRDTIIDGVNGELDTVVSLYVHYSRTPMALGPADKNTATEIPAPHDELLVVDLAMTMLRLTTKVPMPDVVMAMLADEEKGLLAQWAAYVAGYAPIQDRFAPEEPRAES